MAFDPEAFVKATIEGPLSTQIAPCPEGVYTAVISDEGETKDWFKTVRWNDAKTGQPHERESMKIPLKITDDGVRAQLGRETILVNYDIFLDLTKSGALDKTPGKNVRLGQLFEALGMNDRGASIERLRGAGPLMVKISQRSDKNDPSIKYAQVDRVAKVT